MPSAVSALRSSYRRLEDGRRVTVPPSSRATIASTHHITPSTAPAADADADVTDISLNDVDLSTLAEVRVL